MNEEKLNQYFYDAMDAIVRFAPNLIGAGLTLLIGWWLLGKFEQIIVKQMQKRQLESSLQAFFRTLFSIGTKIILLIMVAGEVGFETTSFAAILGAAGLAVGLALQGSLANFAGGVLILIFKPFKVNDTITAAGFTGLVYEIQIFNTILILPDNSTVILPNGAVSNGAIVNKNKLEFIRSTFYVSIPGDSDVALIKQKLSASVQSVNHVLQDPALHIQINELSGGNIKLAISYCFPPKHNAEVQSELQVKLLAFYRENNLAF